MKALILNSGIGKRMGDDTKAAPKCLVPLTEDMTIISRQLIQMQNAGIEEAVITTGPFAEKLEGYVKSLGLQMQLTFVNNPHYLETNYIYSIYSAREWLEDDIVLVHGDLVFEQSILERMLNFGKSCMAVNSLSSLPEKDFKAVIEKGKIVKVGIEFFDCAVTAQPLYVLQKKDWMKWLQSINEFCAKGMVTCYAENALNTITDDLPSIFPFEYGDSLCQEIDIKEDLEMVRQILSKKTV